MKSLRFIPGAVGVVLLALLPFRPAQAQSLESTFRPNWVKSLPTATMAAAAMTNNSFVVTGWYWRPCVLEGFYLPLQSGCPTDGYMARFGKDGTCKWAHRVGGGGTDRLRKIMAMPNGDFVVAGDFNSTSDYGGLTISPNGYYDGVIARFDSNGVAKWVNKLGSTGDDYANDLQMAGDTAIIVTGSFFAGAYFDAMPVSGTRVDHAFIAGLDPNTGLWRWVKPMNAYNNDYITCSAMLPGDSSMVVAGHFKGPLHIGAGGFNNLGFGSDVWIAKMNKKGNWAWAKQIGGGADDYVSSVVGLPDGSVIAQVMAKRTVKFLPSTETRLAQNDQYDIFYVKYSKTGQQRWIRQMGGRTKGDWASRMVLNSDGNLSVSGYFTDTTVFSPTITLITDTQTGFLGRMDTAGHFFSVMPIEGSSADFATAQAVDHSQITDSTYVLAGSFYSNSSTINIGSVPYNSSTPDFIGIMKPSRTPIVTEARPTTAATLQVYPNPAHGRVTVSSPTAMRKPIVLTDALGKEVLRLDPAGLRSATLNTASLPPGLYILQSGAFSRKLTLER